MITFRRLTLLFFILLLSLNLLNIVPCNAACGFIHPPAPYVYAFLISLYLGISVAMAFLPCSNFHHPVICKGKTEKKMVSITFDDGPDPIKTPGILDVLKKNNATATFFCIGHKLRGNEQILTRINEEGHLIGNHSFSHSKWFDFFPARKMSAELMETDRIIRDITGKSPLFFRPPFGVVNPMVSKALKHMPWKTVCWNIRSLDTMGSNQRKIMNHIIYHLKPGSIILMHDFTPFVENCLDELLVRIDEAGYDIAPLDILLNTSAYA
jgi:peptidoglycan/xylan/chitin deacetylase (PgdA/CDA1 family)